MTSAALTRICSIQAFLDFNTFVKWKYKPQRYFCKKYSNVCEVP